MNLEKTRLALAVLTFARDYPRDQIGAPTARSHVADAAEDCGRSYVKTFYAALRVLNVAAGAYLEATQEDAADTSAFMVRVFDAAPVIEDLRASVHVSAQQRMKLGFDPYAMCESIPRDFVKRRRRSSYGRALVAAKHLAGVGFRNAELSALVRAFVDEYVTNGAAVSAPVTGQGVAATPNAPQTKPVNPKDAASVGKLSLTCVPLNVMGEVALGMMEGARKYGRHNYRSAGALTSVQIDAALRHIAAFWEGETTDPASGICHVSKAMSALAILRDAQMRGVAVDDRPPFTPAGWLDAQNETAAELVQRFPNALPAHTAEHAARAEA